MGRGTRRAKDLTLLRSFFKKAYAEGRFLPLVPSAEVLRRMEENLRSRPEGVPYEIAGFLKDCGLLEEGEKALGFGEQDAGYLLLRERLLEGRPHLRPMELHECAVARTIAELYGMRAIWSRDSCDTPSSLISALQQANNVDRSVAEYIYYAPEEAGSSFLMLLGGPNTTDLLFSRSGGTVRIEVKGELSKLGEYDFPDIDRDGKLVIDEEFRKNRPGLVPFAEEFNRRTSIFKILGSNFSLVPMIEENPDWLRNAVRGYLDEKSPDIFLFEHAPGKGRPTLLVPVLPDFLCEAIDFSGSEIRSNGRNHKKVRSDPNDLYFRMAVAFALKKGGRLGNGRFLMPAGSLEPRKERGKEGSVSGWKLNGLFFFKGEPIETREGEMSFSFLSLQRTKPSISIHARPRVGDPSLFHLELESLEEG